MFGFLMLLLIAILLIAFIWHCCALHWYLQGYVHFVLSKSALRGVEENTKPVIRNAFPFFA